MDLNEAVLKIALKHTCTNSYQHFFYFQNDDKKYKTTSYINSSRKQQRMSCTKDDRFLKIPQHGLYCISGAYICFVLYTGAFYMFRTVPHRWVRRQTFI